MLLWLGDHQALGHRLRALDSQTEFGVRSAGHSGNEEEAQLVIVRATEHLLALSHRE